MYLYYMQQICFFPVYPCKMHAIYTYNICIICIHYCTDEKNPFLTLIILIELIKKI